MDVLKGPRIELRTLEPTPANAAVVWCALKENKSHIGQGGVYLMCSSAQDMEQHISSGHRLTQRGGLDYYIFNQGKCIGSLWGEVSNQENTVMLTGWIDKNHSGQGYMQEALRLMEDTYFKNNKTPLGGYVFKENAASLHMMKKMGYHVCNAKDDFFVQKTRAMWLLEKSSRCIVSSREKPNRFMKRDQHVYS